MLVFCCGESGHGVQLTYRENIQTKVWWNIFLTPTFIIMLATKHGIQFWSVLCIILTPLHQEVLLVCSFLGVGVEIRIRISYIISEIYFSKCKKIFDFMKKIFEFVRSYSSVSMLQWTAMHGWNDLVHFMS